MKRYAYLYSRVDLLNLSFEEVENLGIPHFFLLQILTPSVVIAIQIAFPNCSNLFQSRFDILKIHSRKMNLMRGIDLKKIAEKMNGASGAELKVFMAF